MNQEIVVPVSSLILKIKNVLNQNINLSNIWIQGEISNLTKHRSGHYYFSLKDSYSEISCIMFSSYVKLLEFQLEEGMSVCIQGNVNVYEQRGTLQLNVKTIRTNGIGDLYLQFEQRKKKLSQQGYFKDDHKKEKPEWIENIAIVSAKDAAALQDVLKTIRLRFPIMKMKLYPAYVQGNQASRSIIQALLKADVNHHDAILLVRGGGSFEDLFCFNDEELVKTIYRLNTYIVSGVGHESDITLCDLVCDQRCATPTAAAQFVSADLKELKDRCIHLKKQCISNMNHLIQYKKSQFQYLKNQPYLMDPHSYIIDKKMRLDSYLYAFLNCKEQISNKHYDIHLKYNTIKTQSDYLIKKYKNEFKQIPLTESLKQYYDTNQNHFYKNISLLEAYSPLKVLERGYSITQKNGKIIRSLDDVNIDDSILIQLKDGNIDAKITGKGIRYAKENEISGSDESTG